MTALPCTPCAAITSMPSARAAEVLSGRMAPVCPASPAAPGPTTSRSGAVAVVVDRLGLAIAVGIEQLADMGEAVPLGRVLAVQDDEIVADDVGAVGLVCARR